MIIDVKLDHYDALSLIKEEILANMKEKRYFSSLALLLIIPDLLRKNCPECKLNYTDWCEKYFNEPLFLENTVIPVYNPYHIYMLRNSIIHQGKSDNVKKVNDLKIIIKVNDEEKLIFNDFVAEDNPPQLGTVFDINELYQKMINGAEKFLEDYGKKVNRPSFCVLDVNKQDQKTIEKYKEYKQISMESANSNFENS